MPDQSLTVRPDGFVKTGFSLIEVVVTVGVIGVVMSVGAVRVKRFSQSSKIDTAYAQFTGFERALHMYRAEHQGYPPDQRRGVFPPELQDYVDERLFNTPPALGDEWDWNPDWGPVQPGVSMATSAPLVSLWLEFDRAYDDGSLRTGRVQRSSNGRHLAWRID